MPGSFRSLDVSKTGLVANPGGAWELRHDREDAPVCRPLPGTVVAERRSEVGRDVWLWKRVYVPACGDARIVQGLERRRRKRAPKRGSRPVLLTTHLGTVSHQQSAASCQHRTQGPSAWSHQHANARTLQADTNGFALPKPCWAPFLPWIAATRSTCRHLAPPPALRRRRHRPAGSERASEHGHHQ